MSLIRKIVKRNQVEMLFNRRRRTQIRAGARVRSGSGHISECSLAMLRLHTRGLMAANALLRRQSDP
jgi:hypothetical protein